MDARKGATRCSGSGFNGFVGAMEVVPGEGGDIGAQHQIGVALPEIILVFLRGGYGATNDLKNVAGRTAKAILESDRNAQHEGGTKVTGSLGRDGSHQAAIGETARANLYRLKQAGKRAAGANGVDQISVSQDHGIAGIEVGGDDGHGNLEVFKLEGIENATDEITETMITGQTKPGNAPSRDVAEAQRAAGGDDASQRRAAGVRRSENAADAGAGNAGDGDVVLLEDLQHPEMRKTSGETPS